ncbi:MAG: FAD binding domain-containing protein [Anaerolineales bacterium]|nr:FAD binding domain-containing protein [Anaerolineales bacterium]
MISEYHRPRTLEEALTLLAQPNTRPLGGGTVLNRPSLEQFAVVDLQALGLNKIHKNGNNLEIGATATLQVLLESPHIPPALAETLRLETTYNLRQVATVAGTLVACDGRSPFAAAMLALDTRLHIEPGNQTEYLGNILPLIHTVGAGLSATKWYVPTQAGRPQGSPLLITKIEIPLQTKLSFETVARTPTDRPIVCAALAQWPSGRTRLVIGGWGKSPTLAMDGNEASGIETAARNAAHDAADEWGSAEYRSEVAGVLAKRCLATVTSEQ